MFHKSDISFPTDEDSVSYKNRLIECTLLSDPRPELSISSMQPKEESRDLVERKEREEEERGMN